MADKERTSISVPEMGKWLGLGKTESYRDHWKYKMDDFGKEYISLVN